jgi:hypothetical protein
MPHPSLTMMAASPLPQLQAPSQYRTAKYHDGQMIRIEESRRCQATVEPVTGNVSVQRTRQLRRQHNSYHLHQSSHSNGDGEKARSTTESSLATAGHVTSAHLPSRKLTAKPILIQAQPVKEVQKPKISSSFDAYEILTPPPTPRIGRLATPDLPELEAFPFCHCCEERNIVKYCTSCGSEMERY